MLPTYTTLLRLAWRQYISRFDLILYAHLCFTLPVVVITAYIKEWFPIAETATTAADLWPNFYIQLGIDQVVNIVTCVVVLVVVIGMRRAMQKGELGFIAVLREAMSLYLPLVLLSTIELVLTLLGLSLLILPGILVAVILTFAAPAMAWHRMSLIQAMNHSVQLVRGRFWRVLANLILVQLLLAAVIMFITWSLPVNFYFNIFANLLSAVAASFLTVFIVIMMHSAEALSLLMPKPATDKTVV